MDVDGNFPNHHPDPGKEKNLVDLIEKVKEVSADVGVAFDGDGDRLGAVTSSGRLIYPDQMMMLFSKKIPRGDIFEKTKYKFLTESSCK